MAVLVAMLQSATAMPQHAFWPDDLSLLDAARFRHGQWLAPADRPVPFCIGGPPRRAPARNFDQRCASQRGGRAGHLVLLQPGAELRSGSAGPRRSSSPSAPLGRAHRCSAPCSRPQRQRLGADVHRQGRVAISVRQCAITARASAARCRPTGHHDGVHRLAHSAKMRHGDHRHLGHASQAGDGVSTSLRTRSRHRSRSRPFLRSTTYRKPSASRVADVAGAASRRAGRSRSAPGRASSRPSRPGCRPPPRPRRRRARPPASSTMRKRTPSWRASRRKPARALALQRVLVGPQHRDRPADLGLAVDLVW